ncbi:MAG: hypothetical protein ABI968_03425 [Acidobacteriota bacterium]
MYAALARAVLNERDRDLAAAQVANLRQRHPRASRDELARRLIRSAALQCGAASLLWTGPAAFFGAMPAGPDLAYQVVALNRLILALAAVYRSPAAARNRAAGVAAGLGMGVAADLMRRGFVHVLRQAFPRRPGARSVAGGLVGGAVSYGAAMAVGNFARQAFAGEGTFRLGHRTR